MNGYSNADKSALKRLSNVILRVRQYWIRLFLPTYATNRHCNTLHHRLKGGFKR
jgi:hypothetical protein